MSRSQYRLEKSHSNLLVEIPYRNGHSLKDLFYLCSFLVSKFFRLNYFKIDGVRSIFAARPIVSRECAHYIAVITKQYFPFGVLGQVN